MVHKFFLYSIHAATYLILLTPLIIAPWFVYPFIMPKAVFFWVVAEIIFALWVILAIFDKRYRPRENLLFYSILAFFLLMLLASFRGVNLTISLFSTFERMSGLITLAHGFLIYLALSSTFKTKKEWKRFLRMAVLAGGVTASIFFLDDSVISFLPEARQGSTLGNSSFFGAYIIFPIFFSIYLFLSDKGWKRIFAFVCGVLMIFALYYSHATGAWYAFLGGMFLLFVGRLFTHDARSGFRFHEKARIIAVFLLLTSGVLFVTTTYAIIAQDETILNYLPDDFSQKRIGARLVVWENAWDAIKERPILGWGPENFQVAFVKYFNPCMPLPEECGGEIWFDKAHNVIIDTLVASGFSGLFSYLAIFGIAICLLTNYRKHWLFPTIITALLISYFVQNLFVFDMPTTYLMFFFVLAMVGGITSKITNNQNIVPITNNQDTITKQISIINNQTTSHFGYWNFRHWLLFGYCLLIIGVLVISTYFFGYQSLRSAHLVWQSMHTRVPNIENRLKLYTASLEATPLGNMQTRQSFTNNAILWLQQEVTFPGETLKTIEREAEKMAKENSNDLRSNLILGNFYNTMVKYYILKLKDKDTARIYLEKSKISLEKALELSPTNQQVYLSLSQNYIFRKEYKAAEEILQKAIDLEPRYGDSHYNLGDLYVITKEFDKAAQKFDEALTLGYRVETAGKAAQIAQAYYETKQYEKASKWYEQVIIRKPKDADARWTLATIYKELKDFDKARQQAFLIEQIDERYHKAIEDFLTGIKVDE